jgi:hypothetical protein
MRVTQALSMNEADASVRAPSMDLLAPGEGRIDEHADGAQVAAAIDALWRQIDRDLGPIVGQRGVMALFERSLQLTLAAHPGLALRHDLVDVTMDPAGLASLLAQHPASQAARLGDTFMHTFRALLESLIGPSLTERLLRSVWRSTGNSPAEEPS